MENIQCQQNGKFVKKNHRCGFRVFARVFVCKHKASGKIYIDSEIGSEH